jgi:hypothetical protein
MERFELNIVAQGPQSIWVAVIVIALICATIITVAIFRFRAQPGTKTQSASDVDAAVAVNTSMRVAARPARSQKRPKSA